MNSNNNLFAEFPPTSTEEWEEIINVDLKGADYYKRLVWRTDEGFDLNPYYRKSDIENLSSVELNPGDFPYTRSVSKSGNNWLIRQEIETEIIEDANATAVDHLSKGADAVSLSVMSVSNFDDLEKLLKNIDVTKKYIYFTDVVDVEEFISIYKSYLAKKNIKLSDVKGGLEYDPVFDVLFAGNVAESEPMFEDEIADLFGLAKDFGTDFKPFSINALGYNSAGANISQELALSLSSAVSIIQVLIKRGFKIDEIAPRIMISFSVGPDYFPQISKFRAARNLWANIINAYNPQNENSCKLFAHAVTSKWNLTLYDAHVNMLRTTTAAMSAVIGGCQSLSVNPYDEMINPPDEFSYRIARNQQIILKEEAHLDKVADPSAGSYYIEVLTDKIINKSWEIFLHIEENGGMIEAIDKGIVQKWLEEGGQKRKENVATRKTILVGTNQYPNLNETMLDKILESEDLDSLNEDEYYAEDDDIVDDELEEDIDDDDFDFDDDELNQNITFVAGSEQFDELRFRTETVTQLRGVRPSAYLVNVGNLAMRKARAMFSTNFIGCAGFQIFDNNGFDNVDEAVEEALKTKADIYVVCSSDDEYPQVTKPIIDGIKAKYPDALFILAGYPKEHIEMLKNAGIDEFIHVRANVYKTLEEIQNKLDF